MPGKEEITNWFKGLQDNICLSLEAADGTGSFEEDAWDRPGGGGGRSRVIRNGKVIEKGGVNFSAVWGPTPEKVLQSFGLDQADFYATGVSIVLHPSNPFVPIIHMNVRYFEMSNGVCWFGGGIDLTPHYINPNDAVYFHLALKNTCDRHNPTYYPKFKEWADNYFYVQHRHETRGIGGIFFDHLKAEHGISMEDRWKFVQDVGNTFAPTYTHFMASNSSQPYGEREKNWQMLRRGRYVEFNLVLDRGTKFGLETDGRIESILMSLPPLAGWEYNHQPEAGTPEHDTLLSLKKGVNWLVL
ncbi:MULTISPECIES: oxygen-dependent coproporphyrinogen oxidase [unclassified Imperialibacter]|uniref:oxygen-dependent coproporphyrinogen oxidase n=1 Tax=unclassified Imperialibacter TaxID=2629706 RepID=UPI0012549DCE|nr:MULTISPECIES: oxygen-dependent coproporphyrinogen oxidase [unclassified Imperialibacter]CAD5279671.1 Oxygen-dependent coproporphyrinogen-III oxidase [Imperialibacter sp. 75]CAD5288586.1 Oxygen-dependent coproporphyrinogen-III oxidase [Imperialibacter sp. 89]VVT16019.1 Oxygen-dependent coproporphyrinogen-III oxidase [Imperialibacter sp. EC-SDR9]